jgi:hypothetical protein
MWHAKHHVSLTSVLHSISLWKSVYTSIKKSWEHNKFWLDKSTNTSDSFDLCYIDQQSVVNIQVANISTSTPFPLYGNYPQVTNICEIYHMLEHGFKQYAKYRLWCSSSHNTQNSPGSHPTAVCASACLVAASLTASSETSDTRFTVTVWNWQRLT